MPHPFKQLIFGLTIATICNSFAIAPALAGESVEPVRPTAADTSQHKYGVLQLDDVRVEYLDWGGSGTALVFVAGMGATAHAFDNFAPRFTDRFRVLGITRIGFGETDQPPPTGYGLTSRADQIRAVLDSLHIKKAILIGHSLGGDEITAFAVMSPERTLALIYLDAAIDHTKAGAWDQALGEFYALAPEPSAVELKSAEGYQRFLERLRGVTFPLGEIYATMRSDSEGAIRGRRASPQAMMAIVNGITKPDFAMVRAPVLALYADSETAGDSLPWLRNDEVENKRATEIIERRVWSEVRSERTRFLQEVPSAKPVILHAHHYLFLSNANDTEQHIRTFLSAL